MHVVRVLGKLEPGGAQLAVLRVSRELHRRRQVRTTLLVGDATDAGLQLARGYGIEVLALRCASSVHPSRNLQWDLSTRFADWLSSKLAGADLVHAHMVGAWWAASQVIAADTPFAATEHNQVNWPDRRVRSLRTAARRIDRFYAMGPAARGFAVAAGVRAEVITPARSPVEGLRARAHAGLPVPRVTYAGRLCPDKGPDVLVDAISLLGRRDLMVFLLGEGPLRRQLVDRIEQLGLTDRVLMPGWVDDPWRYVAGSSVHVVPSREEAWSQSAVLALGVGVPVVGSRIDGLAETLSHARGIAVAPEDPEALAAAIADALAGRARIDRSGAVRYAHQFSVARVADFYYAEYQNILATHAARRDPGRSSIARVTTQLAAEHNVGISAPTPVG